MKEQTNPSVPFFQTTTLIVIKQIKRQLVIKSHKLPRNLYKTHLIFKNTNCACTCTVFLFYAIKMCCKKSKYVFSNLFTILTTSEINSLFIIVENSFFVGIMKGYFFSLIADFVLLTDYSLSFVFLMLLLLIVTPSLPLQTLQTILQPLH